MTVETKRPRVGGWLGAAALAVAVVLLANHGWLPLEQQLNGVLRAVGCPIVRNTWSCRSSDVWYGSVLPYAMAASGVGVVTVAALLRRRGVSAAVPFLWAGLFVGATGIAVAAVRAGDYAL